MNIANLVVNGLLVIVGASAFFIYFWTKRNERRDAAIMLVLQIDEVRKNVIAVKQAIDGEAILEQEMFETNVVMTENLWYAKKHLLIDKIGMMDVSTLNNFYQCVENIKSFQQNIKSLSFQAFINNAFTYQNQYVNAYIAGLNNNNNQVQLLSEDVLASTAYNIASKFLTDKAYIPKRMRSTLSKYIAEYDGLNVEQAYSKLRKIAKLK